MRVIELTTKEISPLNLMDECKKALGMMENIEVHHLPVVEEGKYIGLISQTDLLDFETTCTIKEIFSPNSKEISVQGKEHFFEVISLMYEHKLSIIPVVDNNNNYCGTISQEKILFAFAKSLSFVDPGSIIVLKVERKDYSLAEVAQIIESEGGAILMTFIRNSSDSKYVFVTVKINKNNLDIIKRSFERHEYEIEATFLEEDYEDVLKERYNDLMNYLNV